MVKYGDKTIRAVSSHKGSANIFHSRKAGSQQNKIQLFNISEISPSWNNPNSQYWDKLVTRKSLLYTRSFKFVNKKLKFISC